MKKGKESSEKRLIWKMDLIGKNDFSSGGYDFTAKCSAVELTLDVKEETVTIKEKDSDEVVETERVDF
jgi:hypothetical protein